MKPALTVRLQIRAVIIHDENDKVLHSQLAPELTAESDYAAALAAFGLEGITT